MNADFGVPSVFWLSVSRRTDPTQGTHLSLSILAPAENDILDPFLTCKI